MKKITSLAVLLSLASCSHEYTTSTNFTQERTPSSSFEEENLKNTFSKIYGSENAETEFIKYLDRIKSIYLRSELYLRNFDQEIDKAILNNESINFEESNSYKKLIVMRGLKNRMIDKFTYFYLMLTDMSYDKTRPAAEMKLAKKILTSLKKTIDKKDPVEKLALEDLRTHIADALKKRRGVRNKSLYNSELPLPAFKNDAEHLSLLRSSRLTFQKMGELEDLQNNELGHEINVEVEKVKLVDEQGREPQSNKKIFYPSTGTNGNVMGLVFPKGTWALTYDDGPHNIHTLNIAKNLEELEVKATFFWLAQNVIMYPNIVLAIKEKGHTLANHSWSHQQLTKLSDEGLQKEINKSTEVESKAYGTPVEFFRCPYGAGNSVVRIRQRIADLNLIHVFWNVDSLDWQDKDPDSVFNRSKKQMEANGRGVVLFHDIHSQSVIASKKLVEWTKSFKGTEKEMRWVTLPQIVKEMNGE